MEGDGFAYLREIASTLVRLSGDEIDRACALLAETIRTDGAIFTCGNGGSASAASHLVVDLARVGTAPGKRCRVSALCDNVPWLTANSNDMGYSSCFSEQLRSLGTQGDLLIAFSASGESDNLVQAFHAAAELGMARLAIVGFSGGRLSPLATCRVWVDSTDYGVVETAHVALSHLLVHALRVRFGLPSTVPTSVPLIRDDGATQESETTLKSGCADRSWVTHDRAPVGRSRKRDIVSATRKRP